MMSGSGAAKMEELALPNQPMPASARRWRANAFMTSGSGAPEMEQPPLTNQPMAETEERLAERLADQPYNSGLPASHSHKVEPVPPARTDTERCEHLLWTFAIILQPFPMDSIPKAHPSRDLSFKGFVLHTCQKIAATGLEMQVVPRTETSKHKVILLIRCPEKKFIKEYRKLVMRRWRQTGEGVTFRRGVDADGDGIDDVDGRAGHGGHGAGLREVVKPTEADRIQLTALLLSKHQGRGGCGFGNIEHLEEDQDDDPRVVSIFPLHNKEWTTRVTAEWKAAFSLRSRAVQFRTATWETVQRTYRTIRTCCGDQSVDEIAVHDQIAVQGEEEDHGLETDEEAFEEREEANRRFLRAQQEATTAVRVGTGGRGVLHTTRSAAEARLKHSTRSALRQTTNMAKRTVKTSTMLGEFAVRKLAAQFKKPTNVHSSHAEFLSSIHSQYGERFAFLFAFNAACSESFVVLIYVMFGLWIVKMFGGNSQTMWEFYLCLSGVVGLLIPCVWGPAFLSRWDRVAFWYSNQWGSVGVTSTPAPSPFYKEKPVGQSDLVLWLKRSAVALLAVGAVVVAVLAMFGLTLVILELEILVQTAPLCGSWFYQTVWKDYIAAGGNFTSTKIHSAGNIAQFVPSCYGGYSEDPWNLEFATGWPGTGSWLWRGLMMALVGALEGLLIGLVYTEVFTCLALKLAHMRNKRTVQEHDVCVINYTYPFECFGFMAYFWILAFLFIPGSVWLQAYLAENDKDVEISFNTTVNITGDGGLVTGATHVVKHKVSTIIEVWMVDKRFKNQLGPMLVLPVLVGINVPMFFEYFLPAMCVSWQRANRRSQVDEELKMGSMPGSRCSKSWRRCRRCCCTAQCCCSLCRMCRCCVLMCNCCMCDKDRGTSTRLPDPALPNDYDDVQLAADATEAIQKIGNEMQLPKLQRMVVTCHSQPLEDNTNTLQRRQQEDKMELDGQDESEHGLSGFELSDDQIGMFQLHSADEIIVESMLDPLDLPNEYRKVSIIVLLVCMWSGVQHIIPLIGWCSLFIRFKFNFIRLVTFARRPVPHAHATDDSTGGYRPWLQKQIYLSTLVTSLLFCLSTGQLEALWAWLIDRNACQPPTLIETQWKFPKCDLAFISEGRLYDSSDPLYDEASSEGAREDVAPYSIMASNTSCWQPPAPELNNDCPFVQGHLEEWKSSTKRAAGQGLHRVICFVVLENLQIMLLYAMIQWHLSNDGDIREKWKAARLAQHSLVAEQLFPPEGSDKISHIVAASRAREKFKQQLGKKQKSINASRRGSVNFDHVRLTASLPHSLRLSRQRVLLYWSAIIYLIAGTGASACDSFRRQTLKVNKC